MRRFIGTSACLSF